MHDQQYFSEISCWPILPAPSSSVHRFPRITDLIIELTENCQLEINLVGPGIANIGVFHSNYQGNISSSTTILLTRNVIFCSLRELYLLLNSDRVNTSLSSLSYTSSRISPISQSLLLHHLDTDDTGYWY